MYSSLFFRLIFFCFGVRELFVRKMAKKTCRLQFDQRVFPETQIITLVVYIIAESRSFFLLN